MFGTLPVLALLATTALASPYKRADNLEVKINGPGDNVRSVDGLKFTAEVTNTGSDDIKVLKYGTVLDSLPTRSFSVTKDGKSVGFNGAKVTVDHKKDAAYTTIKSGETVKVEHDLASLYNFASSGVGKFDFKPNTNFRIAGASDYKDNKLESALREPETISVNITDDVEKRALRSFKKRSMTSRSLGKRATVQCDDSEKADFIEGSYKEGKELASLGSSFVADNADSKLVTGYFGGNPTSDVIDVLDAVANEDDSSRTLNCSDEYDACDGGVIAYTLIATTNIYFCDIFYDEVPTPELCSGTSVADRNIRGGTTLHEVTHATSETEDVTYGCDADQELSDSEKIMNADNYNCFTTQIYADSEC